MEIFIDSEENKRLDLSFDWRVNDGTVKDRRFVVTNQFGDKTSFENFLEAVEAYKNV